MNPRRTAWSRRAGRGLGLALLLLPAFLPAQNVDPVMLRQLLHHRRLVTQADGLVTTQLPPELGPQGTKPYYLPSADLTVFANRTLTVHEADPIPSSAIEFHDFRSDAWFSLICVPDFGLPLQAGEVARGLLQVQGFDFERIPRSQVELGDEPLGPSLAMSFTERVDGDTSQYRLSVRRLEGLHVLVFSGTPLLGADAADRMKKVHEALLAGLVPGLTEPDAARLTRGQSVLVGKIVNWKGMEELAQLRLPTALRCFQQAIALEPENLSYLSNLTLTLFRMDKPAEVLRVLEARPHMVKAHARLLSHLAYAQYQVGNKPAALAAYRQLNQSEPYDDVEDHGIYLELLAEAGDEAEMVRTARAFHEKHPSPEARRQLVHFVEQSGYATLLGGIVDAWQSELTPAEWLDIEITRARLSGNTAQLNGLLDHRDLSREQEFDLRMALGAAAYSNESFQVAQEHFDHAKELYPANEDVLLWLASLRARLGRGDASLASRYLDPVPYPDTLLPIPRHPPLADTKPAYDYDIRALDLRPGQRNRHSLAYGVTLSTQQMVNDFKTLYFPFEPLSEQVYLNELTVRDPDGSIRYRGSIADCYTLDQIDGEIVSDSKWLCVPVKGQREGGTVEVVVTYDRFSVDAEDLYRFEFLSRELPVRHAAVWVTGAVEQLRLEGGGLNWRELPGVRVACLTNVLEYQNVRHHPPVLDSYAWFALAHQDTAWTAVATNYLQRLPAAYDCPKGFAGRAFGPDPVPPERALETVLGFLRTNVVYQALEFGDRGQIPKSPDRTLMERSGDCKDMAVLAHALLKQLGYASRLALVNTEQTLVPSLPSLDQFNHMILYCPDLPGSGFFDPTDPYGVPQRLPAYLIGNAALVLDGADSRLLHPEPNPDRNGVEVHRTVASGTEPSVLRVTDQVTLHHDTARFIRLHLTEEAHKPAAELLSSLLWPFLETAVLEEVEVHNLDQVSEALRLTVTYRLPALPIEEGRFRLISPWIDLFCKGDSRAGAERKVPVYLSRGFDARLALTLDETLALRSPIPPQHEVLAFGEFAREPGPTPSVRYRLEPGHYPSGTAGELETLFQRASSSAKFELRRTPPSP